jgi:aldose sugar dehydrogenase
MKAPVVLVTAALTVAILLAASFLIATGTRGENAGPVIGREYTAPVTE